MPFPAQFPPPPPAQTSLVWARIAVPSQTATNAPATQTLPSAAIPNPLLIGATNPGNDPWDAFATTLRTLLKQRIDKDGLPKLPPVVAGETLKVPPTNAADPSLPDSPTSATPGNLDAPRLAPTTVPPPAPENAVPSDERGKLYIEEAGELSSLEPGNNDVVVASGDVKLRYNGYKISGQRATYDRKRKTATVEGGAIIDTGRELIFYDYLRINLDTNEFFGRQGRTVAPPEQFGGRIVLPLRLTASIFTREGSKNTVAEEGFLSTCDFDLPHYRIGFRKATIIPNKRLVLRDATLYFHERKILTIPYLAVPIRDREPRFSYLPLVGRTEEEGYFIKNAIGYSFGDTFPGFFRLDQIEKKGTGYGFDQAYQFGKNAAGALFLYTLNDRSRDVRNFAGRLSHQQRIETAIANITTDFQNNSYSSLSPTSQTSNTTINVTRPTPVGNTGISLSLQNSDYGTSDSTSTAYTLTQEIRGGNPVGNNVNISLRLNGTRNVSNSSFLGAGNVVTTTQSGRQDQNGDVRAQGRLGVVDIELNANKNLLSRTIGTQQGGYFAGTERLPDLLVRLPSERLGGVGKQLGSIFSIGYARFVEGSTVSEGRDDNGDGTNDRFDIVPVTTTTDRVVFNMDASPQPFRLTRGGGLTLRSTGNFRQSVYKGGETEQYILQSNQTLTQRIARDSNLSFTYAYLRPYGGLPVNFRLDQTGAYNNANLNLNVNLPRFRLTTSTGYDIQRARDRTLSSNFPRNPWQNLSLQMSLRPIDVLETRFTFSYDINSDRLIDATNRLRVRLPFGFALDTGLRYDPRTRKFPQINTLLETPLSSGFRISAVAGYNGITNKFEYKNIALVRSYHDFEIGVRLIDQPYGFRTERGFNLVFRLKAFPQTTQQPAVGQFGTAFDTGTGSVF